LASNCSTVWYLLYFQLTSPPVTNLLLLSCKLCAAAVCPAGQFASVSGCIGCPINMYCPLGQNPTPCPNRLITISTGAASLQQCGEYNV
jgi:hypothetical protein